MDKKYYKLLVVRPGERDTHYAWQPTNSPTFFGVPQSRGYYTFLCGLSLTRKDIVQVISGDVYCEKCAAQMPLAVLDNIDL